MKKELLAPAGDIEAGYAAIYYGADAVYLGLKNFSARATVENFAENELNEFVGYAHVKKCKVFVAINTLVDESELPLLTDSLDICRRCHVDAVIVQDLGVARVIKEQYPELALHASTQMAVHNYEGALELYRLGFRRVVLARELSVTEIADIASIPGLETEVFVHGALCYSYSGLCLFSAMEGKGSANRGRCSAPCRALFGRCGEQSHLFSMKDLARGEDVLKLPVTSLKIEGRKKNALYVAAVTDYYRHILDDGKADVKKGENIKQIFSRPWCKTMDKSAVEPEYVGHQGIKIGKVEQVVKGKIVFHTKYAFALRDGIQIEIPGEEKPFGFSAQFISVDGKSVFEVETGDEVTLQLPPQATKIVKGLEIFLASSGAVKNAYNYQKPKPNEYRQKDKINVMVEVLADKIKAVSGECAAEVKGEFAPASDEQKVAKSVVDAFSKTGDYTFDVGKIELINPEKLFTPMSLLNELRRQLYSAIKLKKVVGTLPGIEVPIEHQYKGVIIKTDDLECLSAIDEDDFYEVIYQVSPDSKPDDLKMFAKTKLRIALPTVCRNPKVFVPIINKLISSGYKKWEIGNYWGLALLPKNGIDLSFDSSLYMFNSQAVQMAKEMGASRVTLSVEESVANMNAMTKKAVLPIVVPVYQDTALFTSAVCIRAEKCGGCNKSKVVEKLKKGGNSYTAILQNCMTTVIPDTPFCLKAKVEADFYRIDFINRKYSPLEIGKIVKSFINKRR